MTTKTVTMIPVNSAQHPARHIRSNFLRYFSWVEGSLEFGTELGFARTLIILKDSTSVAGSLPASQEERRSPFGCGRLDEGAEGEQGMQAGRRDWSLDWRAPRQVGAWGRDGSAPRHRVYLGVWHISRVCRVGIETRGDKGARLTSALERATAAVARCDDTERPNRPTSPSNDGTKREARAGLGPERGTRCARCAGRWSAAVACAADATRQLSGDARAHKDREREQERERERERERYGNRSALGQHGFV